MAKDTRVLLGPDALAHFCRDAVMLMSANIPLHIGLADVRDTLSESAPERAALDGVVETMRAGGRLSEALRESGRFPAYMSDLAATGERTGRLDEVMARLQRYYERLADFRRRLRSAVVYPTVLLAMMAAVVAVLIWTVLPVFSEVLSRFDSTAASGADSVMGASTAACAVILALLLLALGFVGFCVLLSRSRGGEERLRSMFSALPFAREVVYETDLCRLTSGMAAMLSSGFALDEAAEAMLPMTRNAEIRARLGAALEAMRAGATQEDALAQSGLYNDEDAHTLRVAARTGALDSAMQDIADGSEERVAERLERASSLLEPVLVAVLTVIVGAVMLAVMIPLIDIMEAIG